MEALILFIARQWVFKCYVILWLTMRENKITRVLFSWLATRVGKVDVSCCYRKIRFCSHIICFIDHAHSNALISFLLVSNKMYPTVSCSDHRAHLKQCGIQRPLTLAPSSNCLKIICYKKNVCEKASISLLLKTSIEFLRPFFKTFSQVVESISSLP